MIAQTPGGGTETVEMLKLVANGGAVVAVIAVTVMFLRFIKAERKENREEREVERKAFSDSLERVVSSNAVAMKDISNSLSEVQETVDDIKHNVHELREQMRKGA